MDNSKKILKIWENFQEAMTKLQKRRRDIFKQAENRYSQKKIEEIKKTLGI